MPPPYNFGDLPFDILRAIIFTLCEDNFLHEHLKYAVLRANDMKRTVYAISHVSRSIRRAALASPLIWANFHICAFHNADELSMWLERSGNAPLRVDMWCGNGCSLLVTAFMQALLRRKERWEYFSTPSSHDSPIFVASFEEACGPNAPKVLSSLKVLKHRASLRFPSDFMERFDFLRHWNMPALCSLCTEDYMLTSIAAQPSPDSPLHRITELTMDDTCIYGKFTLTTFLSGISQLKRLSFHLEDIFAGRVFDGNLSQSAPLIALQFPVLRHLEFHDETLSPDGSISRTSISRTSIWSTLKLISAPNLESVDLSSRLNIKDLGAAATLRAYAKTATRLKSVEICEDVITRETWRTLSELPMLAHLAIRDAGVDACGPLQALAFPSLRYVEFRYCTGITATFKQEFFGILRSSLGWNHFETVFVYRCFGNEEDDEECDMTCILRPEDIAASGQ